MTLTCINVPTPNAKRLASFYGRVLGGIIDESHGGPNRIEIRFAGPGEKSVAVVATQDEGYIRPETAACQGFEFAVPDVDAEYERIRALGIELREPPKDLPWGYRYFSLKDPDGNGIDVVQPL